VKADSVDTTKRDEEGLTALDWAARQGNSKCAKIMIGESHGQTDHVKK
jgi:ankyrin repeat protein